MTTQPPTNGLEKARRDADTLDWLQAEGDLNLSRERHSILLIKINDSVNHLVTEFGRHLRHPTPHSNVSPQSIKQLPQRYPKAATAAATTGAGGALYGLVEIVKLLTGS